jgi:hypothetical protein
MTILTIGGVLAVPKVTRLFPRNSGKKLPGGYSKALLFLHETKKNSEILLAYFAYVIYLWL